MYILWTAACVRLAFWYVFFFSIEKWQMEARSNDPLVAMAVRTFDQQP